MTKVQPRTLSGFMELLPAPQMQLERMMSILRETYSVYGFTPLDTPVIESAEVLLEMCIRDSMSPRRYSTEPMISEKHEIKDIFHMNDIILLKLGEIVLKGLNRKSFEQKLVSNVRRRLAHIGKFRVYCLQSTVYVEAAEDGADMDAAFEALQKVFGIVKLSRAAACEKDKDAIAKLSLIHISRRCGAGGACCGSRNREGARGRGAVRGG